MSSIDDDNKLMTLKSEIRCILLSCKDGLSLREFQKDYRNIVGKSIPFNQFGFKSPLEFLRSLSDTVKIVKRCGGEEILFPVLQESTSHINKMVLGQKPSSGKGSRRPRPFQLPSNDHKPVTPVREQRLPPPGFSQDSVMSARGWESRNIPTLMTNSQPPQRTAPNCYYPVQLNWPGPPPQTMGPLPLPPMLLPIRNPAEHQPGPSELPLVPRVQTPDRIKETSTSQNNCGSITAESKIKPENSITELVSYRLSEDESDTGLKYQTCGELERTFPSENSKKFEDKLDEESEDEKSLFMSENEETDSLISDKMKANFKIILKENPNGILSTKFAQVYKEKFQASLNHEDWGYHSVLELALSCPDIIGVHPSKTARGSANWLFFDVHSKAISEDSAKWIPRQVLENMQELSLTYPNGLASEAVVKAYKLKFKVDLDVKKLGFETIESFLRNCPSVSYSVEHDQCLVFPVNWGKQDQSEFEDPDSEMLELPLEHVEFLWKDLFLSFVCNPIFKYQNFVIPEEVTRMKVIISDAVSPDLIWLQNTETSVDLKDLMNSMQLFYGEQGNNFLMTESMIVPGLACAAKFMNMWHRARIHQPRDGEIKVLYVDYGTTGYVKYKELRTLHKKFSDLPVQAIKAKLYGICPLSENGWSSAAVNGLFSMCLDNVFVAEVVKVKLEVSSLEVILHDPEDKEVVINKELVSLGFAQAQVEEFESKKVPGENTHSHEIENGSFSLKSLPPCFINLLPFWLNASGDWNDVYYLFCHAQETLKRNGSSNSENHTDPPLCCAHHSLGQLFIDKPDMVCEAWEETVKKWRNTLKKTFIQNLSLRLKKSLQLQNNKLCCSGNVEEEEVYEEDEFQPAKGLHKLNSNVDEFIPRNLSNNHVNTNSESTSSLHVNCAQDINDKSEGSLRSISSLSVAAFTPEMNLENKSLFITTTCVNDLDFHLLVFDDDIFMLRDELFKKLAPKSSPETFKMKLRSLKPDLCRWIPIGPRINKYVHDELIKENIIGENDRASVIPLPVVGRFLMAILPNCSDVAHHFSILAEKLEQDINEMKIETLKLL